MTVAEAGVVPAAQAIAALQASGAASADPARFRFIEALARRAADYRGEVRDRMEARLAAALDDYRERTAAGVPPPSLREDAAAARAAQRPLAALTARLQASTAAEAASLPPSAVFEPSAGGELKAIRYFRASWARLSVAQQLAEALAEVPDNAGPLNSQWLVLRALQRMNEISPACPGRFMGYAEALLWLEQAGAPAAPAQATPGAAARQRKSPR